MILSTYVLLVYISLLIDILKKLVHLIIVLDIYCDGCFDKTCLFYYCFRYTVVDAPPTLFLCPILDTSTRSVCVITASCSRSHRLPSTNEKPPYIFKPSLRILFMYILESSFT